MSLNRLLVFLIFLFNEFNNVDCLYAVLSMCLFVFDRGLGTIRNSNISINKERSQQHVTWFVEGTFAITNTTILLTNVSLDIVADSAYALNNITLVCSNDSIANCDVTISSNYKQSVNFINVTCINECGDSMTNVDNETITRIKLLTQLIDEFEFDYLQQCSSNTNNTMIFDIGYPLYGELSIINNNEGSAICCRGSQSCSYSKRIYSNLGSIFCTGDFSCGLSQSIWTSDFVDIIGLCIHS